MAANKVTPSFSASQAEALVKALGSVPKQTKTIEALVGKVKEAQAAAAAV